MKHPISLSSHPTRQRILILDDHPMTRQGLAQLISHEPDLMVCAEAEAAHQAMASITRSRPDLVVADITMPGKSGLEFIRDMRALYPAIPVLVISMHDETVYAERVLRTGGRGYVMKSEGGARVLEAIRRVLHGEVYLSAKMATALLGALGHGRPPAEERPLSALTNREFEVLQLIGQGLPTTEIARRLHLSIKTIGTHRIHIKEKLNLATASQLITYAVHWVASQQ